MPRLLPLPTLRLCTLLAVVLAGLGTLRAQLPWETSFPTPPPHSMLPREYRAVWLTTLSGLDWPHTTATTPQRAEQQRQELVGILDRLQAAGINTVLFQTRLRGTVAYPSDIEPWDGAFSGTPGRSPLYDPLRFAIDECHRRKMELHAWVVSFPVCKFTAMKALGNQALPRRRPELCQPSNAEYIMDPGVPETADYLARLCREIAERYDIDGIHLDYIRYPEHGVRFNDQKTYRRYGQGQPLRQWRMQNVTRVVRRIHDAVKAVRPTVKMSCAPVGKYADLPRQSSRGWNARDAVCQDAIGWLNAGLMDVLFPMMYFDGSNFYPFVADWQERAQRGVIVPGLGAYCLAKSEKDWPLLRLQRQLNFLRSEGLGGFALFRSRFLTDNVKGLYDWLAAYYDRQPVLTPPIADAPGPLPAAPDGLRATRSDFSLRLDWQGAGPFNVYRLDEAGPTLVSQGLRIPTLTVRPALPLSLHARYAVCATDAYGRESAPAVVQAP